MTYSLRGIYGETEGFVAGSQDILVDAFIENLKRDGVNCRKLPDDKVNTYLLNIGEFFREFVNEDLELKSSNKTSVGR